ncbi:MAG: hypothetical protein EHM65_01200 [Acidobacteriales bacterium]|nr:MAG: hypothetical protein EHM65_01200 [Terriglobales bacterium]
MESTKLNQYGQLVLTHGIRRAIITKMTGRWSLARGWKSDAISKDVVYLPTKAAAISYAKGWLNDQ